MGAAFALVGALLVVGVVVAAVVFFVVLATKSKRVSELSNQVVPGTPTTAPDGWAGAHTPEALLHRRLVDAIAALRAVPGLDGMALDRRADVERHALELDARLVAVAGLPERLRAEPLGAIEGDVKELEMGVAALTVRVADQHRPLDDAFADLAQRLDHLDQARNELDAAERRPSATPIATPPPTTAPADATAPEPTPAPAPESAPPQTEPPS